MMTTDAQINEQDAVEAVRKWDEESDAARGQVPRVDREKYKPFLEIFGKMVRRYRTQAGLNQTVLAKAVNSPRTSIGKMEAGTLPHLPFHRGLMVCRELGIPLRLVIHECLEAEKRR